MSKVPLCVPASFISTLHLQVKQPFVWHHESEDLHATCCHRFTKTIDFTNLMFAVPNSNVTLLIKVLKKCSDNSLEQN